MANEQNENDTWRIMCRG